MESMEKCSYLTHLQLYQRDHLVPGFPASLCCAALGTGAHDLQRGTRARVPLETAEVSNPPTAKGAR